MADLLTPEEAQKVLGLNADQLDALVKSGGLRRFLDQGNPKYRGADLEAYKAAHGDRSDSQADSDTAILASKKPKAGKDRSKDDTSKLDLEDIEFEEEADEGDQTSVLPSADDGEPEMADAAADDRVFEFGEDENNGAQKLDVDEIALEGELDESDQTSMLPSADEAAGDDAQADSGKPEFAFDEEEIGISSDDDDSDSDSGVSSGAPTEQVAAAEGDSSSDLFTAAELAEDESSGEAAIAAEEESSGEEAVTLEDGSSSGDAAVALEEESSGMEDAVISDSEVVTDLLVEEPEDAGSEDLETIGPDALIETGDTIVDEAAASGLALDTGSAESSSAETHMLSDQGDEAETVGLALEAETEDVGEELLLDAAAEPELEPGFETAPVVAAGVVELHPSLAGNFVLFLAVLVLGVLGFLLVCDAGVVPNPVTDKLIELVNQYL